MTSAEYWQWRELIHQRIDDEQEIRKKMQRLYQYQFAEIEKLVDSFIVRYALKEGITPAEARIRITQHDVKAFQDKAKEYVENKDFSARANEELRLYNVTMRTSRLELLREEIKIELMRLGTGEETTLQEWLIRAGKTDLTRQAGILGMSVKTREALENSVKAIVNDNFLSATFSDRIWQNKRELNAQLGLGLERSLMRGENPIKWAGKLKRFLNDTKENATYNAERLAVTETSRVQETISRQSYAAMGYTQVEVICEPSACKICKPFDETVVDIDKTVMGENVPLWHPWCKCTTAPYMDRSDLDNSIRVLELSGEYLEKAKFVEPKTTKMLTSIANSNSAKMSGLQNRLKTQESLMRKIITDAKEKDVSLEQSASEIKDVLRYTMTQNPEKFTETYFNVIDILKENGYNVIRVRNTFKQNVTYKGINVVLTNESGYVFELQFHTPESLAIKEEIHKIYEKQKITSDKEEYIRLDSEMKKISDAVEMPLSVDKIV